jgi:beta-lactamase superfamily II metal-dependent hydrolase
MDFIEAGFSDCIIEGLYYNFPSLSAPGHENWKKEDSLTIREFYSLVEKHSYIPRYKLHTGQHFFIRNLEFEVLGTHEDLHPLPITRFNDSSTILLMTVDGCKTLFLGDSNVAESTILVARYGSYMKSDIVQVAHHGYNASNVGIYYCAQAKVAMYSTPQSRYEADKESESNKAVHRISKEIYVSDNGTVAFPLPYYENTAITYPKEII